MDTFVNLTEKEFDALLRCIQATSESMSYGDGYTTLGWDLQEYRAYQRMCKKMYDRHVFARDVLRIKGSA
jgi:hypothetical protein